VELQERINIKVKQGHKDQNMSFDSDP